ncbi:hypothetical protein [Nonomuraea sp. LPB2021202275-12-8]|uniref:hypothetical protein n=1 Tax=Nonomuraea sp. LPB2021202275-12-8 TaxID=3120159 RepID=UPI00300C4D12
MNPETSTNLRINNPMEISMTTTKVVHVTDRRLQHPTLPDVWTDYLYVTPDVAERLLELNTHNRNMRERTRDAYSRDMDADNWPFNGDTLCLGRDGDVLDAILLDGQHRLNAIIASGVSMWMLVVYGLEVSTQETMDNNILRQVSDHLRINGVPNGNQVAALARKVMLWENGFYALKSSTKWTTTELLDLVDDDERIVASAAWSASNARHISAPGSIVSLAHWLLHQKEAEQADWFMERLVDGVMLEEDHPVRRLRIRLDKENRISETEALALIISAWNAFRAGEKRKKLQLPNPLTNDTMPKAA